MQHFVLLVQNVPPLPRDVLTTGGDGDGELLVSVSTVGPHSTDDVDHPLLGGSRPGQRSLLSEWSTSMSRSGPRNCYASSLMP